MGMPALPASPLTIRYSSGNSASVTGLARADRIAILSEKKYAMPFIRTAKASASGRYAPPANREPIRRTIALIVASSSVVFRELRLFIGTHSPQTGQYRPGRGLAATRGLARAPAACGGGLTGLRSSYSPRSDNSRVPSRIQ